MDSPLYYVLSPIIVFIGKDHEIPDSNSNPAVNTFLTYFTVNNDHVILSSMNNGSFNSSFSGTTISRILLHDTVVGLMGILIRGCLGCCPVRCWHVNKYFIIWNKRPHIYPVRDVLYEMNGDLCWNGFSAYAKMMTQSHSSWLMASSILSRPGISWALINYCKRVVRFWLFLSHLRFLNL